MTKEHIEKKGVCATRCESRTRETAICDAKSRVIMTVVSKGFDLNVQYREQVTRASLRYVDISGLLPLSVFREE